MPETARELAESLEGKRVRITHRRGWTLDGTMAGAGEKGFKFRTGIGGYTIYYYSEIESIDPIEEPTTEPLDLAWARRCATDYAAKPTEARARNAAQCLPGVLAALDILQSAALPTGSTSHPRSAPWSLRPQSYATPPTQTTSASTVRT